jgi:hypothetical protein
MWSSLRAYSGKNRLITSAASRCMLGIQCEYVSRVMATVVHMRLESHRRMGMTKVMKPETRHLRG